MKNKFIKFHLMVILLGILGGLALALLARKIAEAVSSKNIDVMLIVLLIVLGEIMIYASNVYESTGGLIANGFEINRKDSPFIFKILQRLNIGIGYGCIFLASFMISIFLISKLIF